MGCDSNPGVLTFVEIPWFHKDESRQDSLPGLPKTTFHRRASIQLLATDGPPHGGAHQDARQGSESRVPRARFREIRENRLLALHPRRRGRNNPSNWPPPTARLPERPVESARYPPDPRV